AFVTGLSLNSSLNGPLCTTSTHEFFKNLFLLFVEKVIRLYGCVFAGLGLHSCNFKPHSCNFEPHSCNFDRHSCNFTPYSCTFDLHSLCYKRWWVNLITTGAIFKNTQKSGIYLLR